MSYKTEDFIGVWEDAFNDVFCKESIQYFQDMHEAGYSKDRQKWQDTSKHLKEDLAITASFEDEVCFTHTKALNKVFLSRFFELIDLYVEDYSILSEMPRKPNIWSNKIQKTGPGQGYHLWHCENLGDPGTRSRILAYILYLNDVEEGGETEFLYLGKRIKPKAGTLIVFPTGFTHTHRGNPPLSGDKYIMTGWVEISD